MLSTFLLGLFLTGTDAAMQSSSTSQQTPTSTSKEVEKPLDISGQNRNLQMMMVLKGDREEINFVDIRRNYEDQIPRTLY